MFFWSAKIYNIGMPKKKLIIFLYVFIILKLNYTFIKEKKYNSVWNVKVMREMRDKEIIILMKWEKLKKFLYVNSF